MKSPTTTSSVWSATEAPSSPCAPFLAGPCATSSAMECLRSSLGLGWGLVHIVAARGAVLGLLGAHRHVVAQEGKGGAEHRDEAERPQHGHPEAHRHRDLRVAGTPVPLRLLRGLYY